MEAIPQTKLLQRIQVRLDVRPCRQASNSDVSKDTYSNTVFGNSNLEISTVF